MADTSPLVSNTPGPQSAAARGKLASRAAMASVAMAATLLALKIWASISTGSVSVLGSLADTTLDIIASLVTLFSVRLAAEPADDEHGFGHGKAEAISALFQTWLIGLSALGIAWQAITRLGSGAAPSHPTLGIAVSAFAMAATLLLIWYQKHVVRQTGSVAIAADSAHYSSDLLLNAAVIAALVLDSLLGVRGADPLFGLAIAGWLAGLEPVRLEVSGRQLVLEAGLEDRWLLSDLPVEEAAAAAEALATARRQAGGLQFLAVQSEESDARLQGFWMLRDLPDG